MAAARSRSAGRASRSGGQRRAREGADLVAQDGRRRGQERLRLAQRRPERPRPRPQVLQRRPEHAGHRVDLGQRLLRRVERRGQLLERRPDVRLLVGERGEHRVRALDEPGELGVLAPELLHQQREVVDDALEIALAQRELLVRLARVAGGRLEAADGPRQRAAVAPQPLGAVAQQQLQIVARVGVERGEDLVEVHVRQRLRRRDPLALGQLARLRGARRQLRRHVLQPGLRPQQDRGVAVDRRVLALDLHPDDRPAALEVDARDLADLDAGDVDGLPLTGRDGLGGGQLGLDLDVVLAEHRHAGRQREPLVGEDDPADDQRDDEQDDDRHEVAPVLADRGAHLGAPSLSPKGRSFARSSGSAFLAASAAWPVGGDLAAAGPLRFGRVWV